MKFIVRNESDLSDIMALTLVQAVIEQGLISADKAYCPVTTFTVAARGRTPYTVLATRNKASDTFVIKKARHAVCANS